MTRYTYMRIHKFKNPQGKRTTGEKEEEEEEKSGWFRGKK